MQAHYRLIVAALAVCAVAFPSTHHVLHEKRSSLSLQGRKQRVDSDSILPIRIALKQNDLDVAATQLAVVSDPTSPSYGMHLSASEAHDLFAPAAYSIEAVKNWLLSSGIKHDDILHYENKGWLAINNLPASKAEELFRAEYYEYDTESGPRLGCEHYYLPAHLTEHIDFIKPAVMLSAPIKKTKRRNSRDLSRWKTPGPHHLPGPQRPPFNWTMPAAAHGLPAQLANCGVTMTPVCIQALYNMPNNTFSNPVNKMGVYEEGDSYAQSDINLFFQKYAPWVPQDTAPEVVSIDGGKAPVSPTDPANTGESEIDLDLTMSLLYPLPVVLYQTDDTTDSTGSFGTFLDAVSVLRDEHDVFLRPTLTKE